MKDFNSSIQRIGSSLISREHRRLPYATCNELMNFPLRVDSGCSIDMAVNYLPCFLSMFNASSGDDEPPGTQRWEETAA